MKNCSHNEFPRREHSCPLGWSSTRKKSAIHGLLVKSEKSDWPRIQNKYSVHSQIIWSSERSLFLVLTKWSVASGHKNDKGEERKQCCS